MKEELHAGHPGASRMKSIARSFVWWPGMDKELEEAVKQCNTCQCTRHLPTPVPLQPWEWPHRPWIRLHADYAGPFMGKMFLILVDAHSKWMEVKTVTSATSTVAIEHLRSIFATHGLPEMLVTDNGSVFTRAEFKLFLQRNGLRHVTSTPYHPATNGLAERSVQTFKEHMRRSSEGSIETRVSQFLFQYRTTPHTTTGNSPAELLLGQRPRTLLDLVVPDVSNRVQRKQEKQKEDHDKSASKREFHEGDLIFTKRVPSDKDWIPGKIVKSLGSLSFEIELEDNNVIRRHSDHIRSRCSETTPQQSSQMSDWMDFPNVSTSQEQEANDEEPDAQASALCRSTRQSWPPNHYGH